MEFSGLQKLAMVDYPGKLAATVFTGGCNLRCPFCHNAVLVLHPDQAEHLSEADILDFLSRRRGLLDGVVLSGGEPLLHDGAADFLRRVRDLGFAVKLDTNGCFPDRLEALLRDGLLDYVAMDIKNSPEKYPQTVGVPNFNLSPVQKSIALLRDAGVEYEFRTTVVRQLHTADDILAIGRWLEGAPRYYLQNFVDSGALIVQGFTGFTAEELHGFQALAQPFFGEVRLRGVE
ncbi:MAG: anaerobic ribonucleoside-triphosphate reductase activating protein [Dysosmobacter sp.]|jgi:pyruvate formate lyase activating enzyme|uniref:anaerobic ribonucleoside-triphosphate reductase activating protein n=1 Tax=Dysosmobacter sp. TaxID=2591382 RepID=UPI003D8F5B2C